MKKYVMMGLLSIVLMLAMCAGAAFAEPVQPSAAQRKITVEGSASVKVKPDVAYVNLGVQTEGKEAKKAQSENAEVMNDILAAITELNIADENIQTSGFNVNPKYNYDTQKTTGYIVTNNVVVTLRDVNQVSSVIDAAVEAGANQTSISFAVADPAPHYRQALQNALRDAESKAKALAEVYQVGIDMPIEIIEQTGYQPYGYTMQLAEAAYDSYARSSTPIQSGDLEISAKVQVVYGY